MAEALGIAASVIGIIQLTEAVTHLGWRYIDGVRRAPKNLQELVDEVESLRKVLNIMQGLLDDPNHKLEALQRLNTTNGPLSVCADDLQRLKTKIEPRSGFRGLMNYMWWPLREADTMQYIARIERHKSLFMLALNTDQISLARDIGDQIQTTNAAVQELHKTLHANKNNRRQRSDGQTGVSGSEETFIGS